jgi:hypothetical protein
MRRDPNHPESGILLERIDTLKSDPSRLDEVFRDHVIERVTQSRTNAEGEVELVDPDGLMRQLKSTLSFVLPLAIPPCWSPWQKNPLTR